MARYIDADLILYTKEERACDDYARRFDIENIPTADVAPKSEVARELFEKFTGILLRLAYLGADGKYHIRRTSASEVTVLVDEYFELQKKYVKV